MGQTISQPLACPVCCKEVVITNGIITCNNLCGTHKCFYCYTEFHKNVNTGEIQLGHSIFCGQNNLKLQKK